MPFKLNQDRRHHIPRQKHKVTNWPAYEAGLRQRGSVTVWFTDEAIAAWEAEPRTTRGGQPVYSALAILTALTLAPYSALAYRQAAGHCQINAYRNDFAQLSFAKGARGTPVLSNIPAQIGPKLLDRQPQ